MERPDGVALKGDLTIFGACEFPENTRIELDDKGSFDVFEGPEALRESPPWMRDAVNRHGHLLVIAEPNGFVSGGLDVFINRAFGVGGPPAVVQSLIVAKSSTAVAATDTSILGGTTAPTFTGAGQNAISKALTAPAPVAAVANAVSGGMSFTNTDVTGGANFWPINRIGLVNVAASTPGGLVDVIGNTAAQADPYSRTFSVDFSSAGVFTLSPQITVTMIRRVADFPVL
ncbi:MAG: hypothetical protein M3003_00880 [Candidatus Dormibacteraeota bacterium]|nr:hypothetical protein [Candidatus Dormibacteraeota bacterium]